MRISGCLILFALLLNSLSASAQQSRIKKEMASNSDHVGYSKSNEGSSLVWDEGEEVDSAIKAARDSLMPRQRDLGDLVRYILGGRFLKTDRSKPKRLNFSYVPSAGYSLNTGFAADVVGNVAFYTSENHHEKLSAISGELTVTSKSQLIFVNHSEIWLNNNEYKFISDVRWERFPEDTYGLGTLTTPATANPIDFNYVNIFENILKKIYSNYYAGIGFNYDYHYKIQQGTNADGSVSDFTKYGVSPISSSSGFIVNALYDSRRNLLNPDGGTFVNLIFRQNERFMGSDASWSSILLDSRHYFKPGSVSNNILAFWIMGWFTQGKVPYLDMPFTAGDITNNSGRGYVEGRYRGKDMLYFESEYRFGILRNGLIGGVVFANAESFTGLNTSSFQGVAPAGGLGLRIKVNKHSNTNVCLDYGFGIHGSNGLFVNLGEAF